jgi:hypothetical protein
MKEKCCRIVVALSFVVALVLGTACSSVQNLSDNKQVNRNQLAMIRVLSGNNVSGQTTVVKVDDLAVDPSKEFVAVPAGIHKIAVDFYKGTEQQRTTPKLSRRLFGNFIPERRAEVPEGEVVIRSTAPKIVSCQLDAGKSYFVQFTDSYRRARKAGTNDVERQMYIKLGNHPMAWELVGDWKPQIRELK